MKRYKFKERLLESPLARVTFHVTSNVLVGLFCGGLIYQISGPSGLHWLEFYRHSSFYGLLITTAIISWYNRHLYEIEKDVLKFADNEYCVAYVRSKCLPAAAEQYRIAIRTGVRGELTKAMEELQRVLK